MACASCIEARRQAAIAVRAAAKGQWDKAARAANNARESITEKFASEAERIRDRLKLR